MRFGKGRGSVSSSSTSAITSKRSERRKSWKLSCSRQQSTRLAIAPVITQVLQVAQYSTPTTESSNAGCCCRFIFEYAHMSEVCHIVPPNGRVSVLEKWDVNKTRTFGNELYIFTNRARLQGRGPVREERYYLPAQSPRNSQQHSVLDPSEPRSYTQSSPWS